MGEGKRGGFQALTKSYKRTSASFPFHRVITYLSLCADQQGFKRKSCMRNIGVVGKDILVSFEKRRFVYKQDNKVLCSCSPSRWVMAVNTIRFHLSASTGGAFGYHVSAAPRQLITILPVFLLFPYLTLGPLAYSVKNQWLLPRASLYYHLPSSWPSPTDCVSQSEIYVHVPDLALLKCKRPIIMALSVSQYGH